MANNYQKLVFKNLLIEMHCKFNLSGKANFVASLVDRGVLVGMGMRS